MRLNSFFAVFLFAVAASSAVLHSANADDQTFNVGNLSYQVHTSFVSSTATITSGGKPVAKLSGHFSMDAAYELLTKFMTISDAATNGDLIAKRQDDGLYVYSGSKLVVVFKDTPANDAAYDLDKVSDVVDSIINNGKAQRVSNMTCKTKLAQVNELLTSKNPGVNSTAQDVIKQTEAIINSSTVRDARAGAAE